MTRISAERIAAYEERRITEVTARRDRAQWQREGVQVDLVATGEDDNGDRL